MPRVQALQAACFPPPFPVDQLWTEEHLLAQLKVFPEGQFVAVEGDTVLGSASSLVISEENWQAHADWDATTGGHTLKAHDPAGTTLYGADISVGPDHRCKGVGRALYGARFKLVRSMGLVRFGTTCRIPDWLEWMVAHKNSEKTAYVLAVLKGQARDRTLTPLLKIGLQFKGLVEDHMKDEESGDAAAILEWTP